MTDFLMKKESAKTASSKTEALTGIDLWAVWNATLFNRDAAVFSRHDVHSREWSHIVQTFKEWMFSSGTEW